MIYNFSYKISRFNKYGFYIFFSIIFFTSSPVLTERYYDTPLNDIDNQIQNLNSEITNISKRIKELRSDSIKIITEYNTQKSQIENPLSNIEVSLSLAKDNLLKFQIEIKKIKQDSIKVTNSYMEKKQVRSKSIEVIEDEIRTLHQNIKLMEDDLKNLQRISKITTDKNIIALKTDSMKTDSLIESYIQIITNLDNKLQELKKDSVTQNVLLQSLHEQNLQKVFNSDSLFQITQQSVEHISQQLSEIQNKYNNLITKTQDELKILTSRKIKLASAYTKQKIQFGKIQNERKQLITRLKALKKQYNDKRAPFVKQLRESDSLLKLRIRQKELWTTMKEKYIIDSSIIETRNELDKQIQLSAKGKRSARKKVQEVENNLQSLLKKQNACLCRPGVKHADSELASLSLSQKKQQINKYLTSINADLERLSDIKKRNELKLSQYDNIKPLKSNPLLQKYRNTNDKYNNMKSQLIILKHQKDSIDSIIIPKQNALNELKTESKRNIQVVESKLASATRKRDQLNSQLKQIKINSNLKEKKDSQKLTHISTQIKSTINDKIQAEQELAKLKLQKKQLVSDISNAFDNLEVKKQKAGQDLITLKNMIHAKKSELDSLYEKKNNLLEIDKNAYADYRTKMTELINMHSSLSDSITQLTTEIQTLQSQSSDLTLTVNESEKSVANKLNIIKNKLNLLNKQLIEKKSDIRVLKKSRAAVIATKKDDYEQVSIHSSNKKKKSIRGKRKETPDKNKPELKYKEKNNFKTDSQNINDMNPSTVNSKSHSPHFSSINTYDSLISAKESELAQLKAYRKKIYMEKQTKDTKKYQQSKSSDASTTVKTQPNTKEIESTNSIIEKIYIFLGENRPDDARKLFSSNKDLLKKHAAPEAIKMLEAAISNR